MEHTILIVYLYIVIAIIASITIAVDYILDSVQRYKKFINITNEERDND